MPKKVLIALPPGMLEQLDYIAQVEHRTRSDLIREAARRYMEEFRKRHTKAADPLPEVVPIIFGKSSDDTIGSLNSISLLGNQTE